MSTGLEKLIVKNYRSLENVELEASQINVLFGPNGAGKTSFLDALWFIRDCAIRGVDMAASDRSHGIGVLWDQAEEGAHISIQIETEQAIYEVLFGFSSGRIHALVGESLRSKTTGIDLIQRAIGAEHAQLYDTQQNQAVELKLREPNRLALSRYLDFVQGAQEGEDIENLLRGTRNYHARSANLYQLRTHGSLSATDVFLSGRCENLWAVLRNIRDQRELGDSRYDTILDFMQKGFPNFERLYIEHQGTSNVYGSIIEKGHDQPIKASAVSDGHLQLLAHLTALFSEGTKSTQILFDEPEISLHPYAIATFAEAVQEAADNWNKQIFIATHSPVLISQFDVDNIIATEIGDNGETLTRRVSEITDIQDLLEQYAAGSLYMAELIAPQSILEVE